MSDPNAGIVLDLGEVLDPYSLARRVAEIDAHVEAERPPETPAAPLDARDDPGIHLERGQTLRPLPGARRSGSEAALAAMDPADLFIVENVDDAGSPSGDFAVHRTLEAIHATLLEILTTMRGTTNDDTTNDSDSGGSTDE